MFKPTDLEKALGVKGLGNYPNATLTGVSIDSRTIRKGEVFFAIRGKKFDGHTFAEEAAQKRAGAFVLEIPWTGKAKVPLNRPAFFVEDTTAALGKLAAHYRRRCSVRSLAITGSCGKTTTKEMAHLLLSRKYRVGSTDGNLNNQFGLPLTIFRLTPQDEMFLAELGASRPRDIAYLSNILEPDVGLITNVHPAHLEGFGSLEKVYETKLELAAFLERSGGILAVCGDQEPLAAKARKFRLRLFTFGEKPGNDFTVTHVTYAAEKIEFEVNERYRFAIQTQARFQMHNFLAALVLAHLAGVPMSMLEGEIRNFQPLAGRFERHDLPGEISVIHDAYNANPDAMVESLEAFAAWRDLGRRKIALLGDMTELGSESPKFHWQVGSELKRLDIPVLITAGEKALEIARGALESRACQEVHRFKTKEEALAFLIWFKRPGDVILLKGSRSMQLEGILEGLREEAAREAQRVP